MITSLKTLLISETGKDSTVVFVGTLINIIIAGLFFILVPRILGPEGYGLFSTIISTGLMAAAIANFGLDTGILRFAPNSNQQNSIFTLALKSYLISSFSLSVSGFLFAPILAGFLGQPQITNLLRIAFFGAIFILFTNFFVSALQAKKEFLKASLVNLSANITRISILILGIYLVSSKLYFISILFFSSNLTSLVIGKFYLSFKFENIDIKTSKEFLKYNFWVAAAMIISSIPFDNYFILKLAGPFQAGLYAAPFKLLTFAYQFGGNFTRVLASRFASFDSDKKAILFSMKALLFPAIFIIGLLILIIYAPFVNLLIGSEFAGSSQILTILIFGFISFFIAAIPSSIILYYFGKSQISFLITAIRYTIFILLLSFFVPNLKAVGAAIAFSLSEFISLCLMVSYILLKFKKVL